MSYHFSHLLSLLLIISPFSVELFGSSLNKPNSVNAVFVSFINKKTGMSHAALHDLPAKRTTPEEISLWKSSIVSALATNDYLVTYHQGRRFFVFTDGINDEIVDRAFACQLIRDLIHRNKELSTQGPKRSRKEIPEYEHDYIQEVSFFLQRFNNKEDVFQKQMQALYVFFKENRSSSNKCTQHAKLINESNRTVQLQKFTYAHVSKSKITHNTDHTQTRTSLCS